MVHSVFKSLLLYFALFASTLVFAAPAHQHQTEHTVEPIVRRVSPRDSLRPPYPLAAELNAPIPAAIGKRSQKYGGGPKKVTNAMRFAHGLPPLAPRKLCEFSSIVFICAEYQSLILFDVRNDRQRLSSRLSSQG